MKRIQFLIKSYCNLDLYNNLYISNLFVSWYLNYPWSSITLNLTQLLLLHNHFRKKKNNRRIQFVLWHLFKYRTTEQSRPWVYLCFFFIKTYFEIWVQYPQKYYIRVMAILWKMCYYVCPPLKFKVSKLKKGPHLGQASENLKKNQRFMWKKKRRDWPVELRCSHKSS